MVLITGDPGTRYASSDGKPARRARESGELVVFDVTVNVMLGHSRGRLGFWRRISGTGGNARFP
jgi:hypothetical protein